MDDSFRRRAFFPVLPSKRRKSRILASFPLPSFLSTSFLRCRRFNCCLSLGLHSRNGRTNEPTSDLNYGGRIFPLPRIRVCLLFVWSGHGLAARDRLLQCLPASFTVLDVTLFGLVNECEGPNRARTQGYVCACLLPRLKIPKYASRRRRRRRLS